MKKKEGTKRGGAEAAERGAEKGEGVNRQDAKLEYDPRRLITPVMAVCGMVGGDAGIVLPDAGGDEVPEAGSSKS